MALDGANLGVLSTRTGFNAAVRHINKTLGIADALGAGNVGDLLFEAAADPWSGEDLALLLSMLLVDKLGYQARSRNLPSAAANPAALAEEFARWGAVDLLAVYHHPDLGLLAANPKDPAQLAALGVLQKWELLVIYAGTAGKETGGLCRKAAETALDLFAGLKTKPHPDLYQGLFTVKKPPQKARAGKPAGPKSPPPALLPAAAERNGLSGVTPHYSVGVTNELFHNGNVEAWKRIIDSYTTKYPDLRVAIYYEGERILDINSLFKWGKVKHGRSIQFSVAGNHIRDVAKLQRYLKQGASPHFEAFLRGPVGSILKLF